MDDIRHSQLGMHYSKLRRSLPNVKATEKIKRARELVAAGNKAYYYYSIGYNIEEARGNWSKENDGAYYIGEWPAGWRVLGRVDEIEVEDYGRRLVDHRGWYTDPEPDQGDTMAGYVLQLPSRNGRAQFVPAVKHSDWDGVTLWPGDRTDDLVEAIRCADRHAERIAEHERDYREAYNHGQDAARAVQETREARTETIALIRDLRAVRHDAVPSAALARLCEVARVEVRSRLARIARRRAKRDKLAREWGSSEGFRNGLADGV